jgi:hypothetical protein
MMYFPTYVCHHKDTEMHYFFPDRHLPIGKNKLGQSTKNTRHSWGRYPCEAPIPGASLQKSAVCHFDPRGEIFFPGTKDFSVVSLPGNDKVPYASWHWRGQAATFSLSVVSRPRKNEDCLCGENVPSTVN